MSRTETFDDYGNSEHSQGVSEVRGWALGRPVPQIVGF